MERGLEGYCSSVAGRDCRNRLKETSLSPQSIYEPYQHRQSFDKAPFVRMSALISETISARHIKFSDNV